MWANVPALAAGATGRPAALTVSRNALLGRIVREHRRHEADRGARSASSRDVARWRSPRRCIRTSNHGRRRCSGDRSKTLRTMVRMCGVHALKGPEPRGLFDLADGIGAQTSRRERVPAERLVVRWPEEMSVWAKIPDDRDRLFLRRRRHHGDVGAVPARVQLRHDIRQQHVMFGANNRRKRRSDVGMRGGPDLDDTIPVYLVHGTVMRPNAQRQRFRAAEAGKL